MACNGRVAARSRGDHAVNDFRSDDGELLDELITDNVVAVGAYVAAVERYRGESLNHPLRDKEPVRVSRPDDDSMTSQFLRLSRSKIRR